MASKNDSTPTRVQCVSCGKEKEVKQARSGDARTPRAWKSLGGQLYCPKCKSEGFALRAVSIPVASYDKETIIPLVRQGIKDCTRCANALMRTYYATDKLAEGEKLPDWTPSYVYPFARNIFPGIEPTALVSLINTVQSKYRALRFDMWRGAVSLPTFRDLPIPINSQAFRLVLEGQQWCFEFRWCGAWYSVKLRYGHEFYRQMTALARFATGDAERGEAAIYWKKKALMVKIAGWFKRQQLVEAVNRVSARTVSDGFLVAVSSTGAEWKLNADHVKGWIISASNQQQRLREDLKAERRFPKGMRKGIVQRMGRIAAKRRDRMNTFCHEASAHLVNWALRQKAAELKWDDSERPYDEFPWFELASRIESKCKMAGLKFIDASGDTTPKTPQPLAKGGSLEKS